MEMEKSVKDGKIKVDGKIVVNAAGELAVTKGISTYQWLGVNN